MKKPLSEQLIDAWKKGYFSFVKNQNGEFRLFAFYKNGNFSASHFKDLKENCALNWTNSWDIKQIDINEQDAGWHIDSHIHPSELMGNELPKAGDKMIMNPVKNKEIESFNLGFKKESFTVLRISASNLINFVEIGGWYHLEFLLPYVEKETEAEDILIKDGKKYRVQILEEIE